MLVWIVYVPTADKLAPDLTRMNRVEEIVDELARVMVNEGSARLPTADEVAAHRQASEPAKRSEPEPEPETPPRVVKHFNQGGNLPAGITLTHNNTGEPEPIEPPTA